MSLSRSSESPNAAANGSVAELGVVYASEAGDNAGESPAGRIELFTTENRANCAAVRRGGE